MIKTLPKKMAAGMISLVGFGIGSNGVEYIIERTLLDSDSCNTAVMNLNYINQYSSPFELAFEGDFGSKKAHEHFLERYCKK